MTSCEPAALELGCIVNNIRHIIVCGHSDCKAMNLLYKLKSNEESSKASIKYQSRIASKISFAIESIVYL